MKCFIWQDSQDSNYYSIGVKQSNGKIAKWLDVFIDALGDCFGLDSKDVRAHISTQPIEIDLSLSFIPKDHP